LSLLRHPAVPYVLPFAVFAAALVGVPRLGLPEIAGQAIRILLPLAAVVWVSRSVLEWRPAHPWASAGVGVAVFAVWIAPDLLFPGWRGHWLFQNPITGTAAVSMAPQALADPLALVLRTARAALLVPVIEELFWRGWLMRWTIRPDFQNVPLGTYSARSFWITALLFAAEHGPYWEVGLAAGAIYNGYMVRVKRLSDLILAHAVTNACLSLYVIMGKRWEYWM
jgi:CAAX prenyl protease-like protein